MTTRRRKKSISWTCNQHNVDAVVVIVVNDVDSERFYDLVPNSFEGEITFSVWRRVGGVKGKIVIKANLKNKHSQQTYLKVFTADKITATSDHFQTLATSRSRNLARLNKVFAQAIKLRPPR